MSQQVIQSYLIRLGYSVDKVQQASFNAEIAKAAKVVTGAIAAITGVAATTIKSMDDLYRAARLAGSNPLTFRAWTEAFSQIGGSANALSGTLQQIGQQLQGDPTKRSLASALIGGKGTTDAIEAIDGLFEKYKALGAAGAPEIARRNLVTQFADVLGADASQINRIITFYPDFQRFIKDRQTALAATGVNEDSLRRAAETTAQFKGALSDLETVLQAAAVDVLPIVNEQLAKLAGWFKNNPDQVKDSILAIGGAFKAAGESTASLLDFLRWLEAHGLLATVVGAAAGGVVAGLPGAAFGAGLGTYYHFFGGKDAPKPDQYPGTTPLFPDAKKDPAKYISARLQSELGLDPASAAAFVGNFSYESGGLNPNAYNPAGGGRGARGLAQFRGSRLDDFRALKGRDIQGSGVEDQTDFIISELRGKESAALAAVKNAKSLRDKAVAVRKLYERYDAEDSDEERYYAAAAALGVTPHSQPKILKSVPGAGGVTVTNNITVTGTDLKPADVGKAAEYGTRRALGDTQRNYSSANVLPR